MGSLSSNSGFICAMLTLFVLSVGYGLHSSPGRGYHKGGGKAKGGLPVQQSE